MGAGDSSTRKVSFGVDEEDKVRILRGVKLSEEVLQRMRSANQVPDVKALSPIRPKEPAAPQARSVQQPCPQPSVQTDLMLQPKPAGQAEPMAADIREDLRKREEKERVLVQEELAKAARWESARGLEELAQNVQRERVQAHLEAENALQLAKQVEKKEAELRALHAFYREHLVLLEKKNVDRYKLTTEQFNKAATEAETNIKARSTAPVCANLQARILNCYGENQGQTLCCVHLAKEYMQCIHAARKNLLVNHG